MTNIEFEVDIDRLRTQLTLLAEDAPSEFDRSLTLHTSRNARKLALPVLAAACVAAASIAVVTATTGGRPASRGSQPAGPAHFASSPSSPGAASTPTRLSIGMPLGRVITTDTPYLDGRLAVWMQRDAADPQHALTATIGVQNGDNQSASQVSAPVSPPELSPGFHEGYDAGGIGQDHHDYLLFGYVVGRGITSVTLDVDGRQVLARTATWSQNASVTLWWAVGPVTTEYRSKAQGPASVSHLRAYHGRSVVATEDTASIAHG